MTARKLARKSTRKRQAHRALAPRGQRSSRGQRSRVMRDPMGRARPLEAGDRVVSLTSLGGSFVYGPGEPMAREGECFDSRGRAASLWTALVAMGERDWSDLCGSLFPDLRSGDAVMAESVLYCAQEVDCVTVQASPKGCHLVWLDLEGTITVEVWRS